MSEYKRALVAVSVPFGDGRHAAEPAGAVIVVSEVAEYMQVQFAENDPWLESLFEDASEADYRAYKGYVAKLEEETKEPEASSDDGEEPEEVHPQKAQRRRTRKVQKEEEAA